MTGLLAVAAVLVPILVALAIAFIPLAAALCQATWPLRRLWHLARARRAIRRELDRALAQWTHPASR